jgi:hypothetical protein
LSKGEGNQGRALPIRSDTLNAIQALGRGNRDRRNLDHVPAKRCIGLGIDRFRRGATEIFRQDQAPITRVMAVIMITAAIFLVLTVALPSDLIKNSIHGHLSYGAAWAADRSIANQP